MIGQTNRDYTFLLIVEEFIDLKNCKIAIMNYLMFLFTFFTSVSEFVDIEALKTEGHF